MLDKHTIDVLNDLIGTGEIILEISKGKIKNSHWWDFLSAINNAKNLLKTEQ